MSDRRRYPMDESKQNFREYLDKNEVTTQVREAVLKLIENQPSEPMLFLADYFDSISTSDKTDKIATVNQILQLSHHSHQSFQTNLIIAYDAASVAKNPNSKKASLNRPGLTGSVFEELLVSILGNSTKQYHAALLERIGCRGSEMVPFDIFRYGVTMCYVFADFLKLCASLFTGLCGKHSGKVTDKAMCETMLDALKAALDYVKEGVTPGTILEAAYGLRPDKLAANLLSTKSDKNNKSTINEDDFIQEMVDVFLSKVKTLK